MYLLVAPQNNCSGDDFTCAYKLPPGVSSSGLSFRLRPNLNYLGIPSLNPHLIVLLVVFTLRQLDYGRNYRPGNIGPETYIEMYSKKNYCFLSCSS